jgi:hypothetical protein
MATTFCHLFLFGSIAAKKAIVVVTITFFLFGFVATKKATATSYYRPSSFWFFCNEKSNNNYC